MKFNPNAKIRNTVIDMVATGCFTMKVGVTKIQNMTDGDVSNGIQLLYENDSEFYHVVKYTSMRILEAIADEQ